MSRTSKGARLWKRPAYSKKDGRVDPAVWVVRDGSKIISTGCLANPTETSPPEAAEKFLADYIGIKWEPKRTTRDVDVISVGEVLAIYHADKREEFEIELYQRRFDARIDRLNDFFGQTKLGALTTELCKAYAKKRGNVGGSRRDLEDLRAAINYHASENLHHAVINVWLPQKGEARDRWLTRDEAAAMLWACWRHREVQVHNGVEVQGKYTLRHVARFILIGLYTGTRAAAVAAASPYKAEGRSHVDLNAGVFYRLKIGKRKTNKRQPPVALPDRLIAHMRRWVDRGIITEHFVEWHGKAVTSVKNGFARAVEVAELDLTEGNVTPHTLRHTAATWLMQTGADPWKAAGFLGMSVQVLLDTYGHHHPDYQRDAANAITQKIKPKAQSVGRPKPQSVGQPVGQKKQVHGNRR